MYAALSLRRPRPHRTPVGPATCVHEQVEREGTSVTLVAHSRPVGDCLEAAKLLEADGISAEVINLRSIRPLDMATVIARCVSAPPRRWTTRARLTHRRDRGASPRRGVLAASRRPIGWSRSKEASPCLASAPKSPPRSWRARRTYLRGACEPNDLEQASLTAAVRTVAHGGDGGGGGIRDAAGRAGSTTWTHLSSVSLARTSPCRTPRTWRT